MWIVDFIFRTQYRLMSHCYTQGAISASRPSIFATLLSLGRWKMKQKTHQIQGKIDCHSFNGSSAATKSSMQLPSAVVHTEHSKRERDWLISRVLFLRLLSRDAFCCPGCCCGLCALFATCSLRYCIHFALLIFSILLSPHFSFFLCLPLAFVWRFHFIFLFAV